MNFHEVSQIFPRMLDDEYRALVDDIRANGVREPIWMWRGYCIDGRHRYMACADVGIDCPTREYEGDEAGLVAFVLSLNLKRRHLDTSQRALLAARISTLKTGQHSDQGVPIGTAAEMTSVGERSVKRARKVIEEGTPELAEAIERGELSVSAAAEVAELPKKEQKRVVAQKRVKETAAELRAEKAPKPEKAPEDEKPSELEALKKANKELREQLSEMAEQQQAMQDELLFLQKIEDEGDKLKAALAEVKRLQALVRVLEERNRGMQAKEAVAVRAARLATEKVARLERELKRLKGK